jgi:hypothetical protein
MSHEWLKMLQEAQTDHDRAKAVFAFRKQVVENKTVEELRKALGVSTTVTAATRDVSLPQSRRFVAASGDEHLECNEYLDHDGGLSGQCVLK